MIKVLILGGGFGGIRCALDLDKKFKGQAQITLVDRNGYHLFLPSLYEAASVCGLNEGPFAVKLRKTICIPYGEIFAGKNINPHIHFGQFLKNIFLPWQKPKVSVGVNFIQAEISVVDLETKNVRTKGGEILEYDFLVIALGSQTADFGISGVSEYAHQFKSIDDAVAVNKQIEKLIKKMASGEKMDPLKILIGGAGFTGLEFAAEISCCIKRKAKDCNVKGKCFQTVLIEAGPKILPIVSERERKIITERLTRLGVVLMENSPIENMGADFVKLKDGRTIEGDMVVWTAGIKANDFLKSIDGLSVTDRGKIMVDKNLQVQDWQNTFAIGDNQEFIDTKAQKPVPSLAYMAVDQGKIAAVNIYNILNGKKLKSYRPSYGVWIAPVGGKFAMAHLWSGLSIGGFMGWAIRELVDLRYLISILSFRKAIALFWQEITIFIKND